MVRGRAGLSAQLAGTHSKGAATRRAPPRKPIPEAPTQISFPLSAADIEPISEPSFGVELSGLWEEQVRLILSLDPQRGL